MSFVVRDMAFLDMDPELRRAAVDWLNGAISGPVKADEVAGFGKPGCLLFLDGSGELRVLPDQQLSDGVVQLARRFLNGYSNEALPRALTMTVCRDDSGDTAEDGAEIVVQAIVMPVVLDGYSYRMVKLGPFDAVSRSGAISGAGLSARE